MTETFASYWDLREDREAVMHNPLTYHQLKATDFKRAVNKMYGEEPAEFNAFVNYDQIEDIDEFLDRGYGQVVSIRAEHYTDKGSLEMSYTPKNIDNGVPFPPNPDYTLRLDGSLNDRDVVEEVFGRRMRRTGFSVIKDLLRR